MKMIPLKIPLRRKISGSGLYYAIGVAVIAGLLSSAFLLLTYFHRLEHLRASSQLRVVQNFRQAWLVLMDANTPVAMNTDQRLSIGLEIDTVMASRESWGLLEVASTICTSQQMSISRNALVGGISSRTPNAVEMAYGEKLTVCGNTSIVGDCLIPGGDVEMKTIDNRPYTGPQPAIEGDIASATTSIRDIHPDVIESMNDVWKLQTSNYEPQVIPLDDTNSFSEPTRILVTAFEGVSPVNLKGNIIWISKTPILLDSRSNLEDIIVVCPSIQIGSNFRGSAQFFVTDSMLVEEYAELTYPSSIVFHPNAQRQFLRLANNSRVEGLIVARTEVQKKKGNVIASIQNGATVEGAIYWNGYVSLKGKVSGSIVANGFFLQTPSATYENHIQDGVIDVRQLDFRFVGLDIYSATRKKDLIKWLE
jgi:hypothetical protein